MLSAAQDVPEDERNWKNHRIVAVENATMVPKQVTRVLHASAALEEALEQVAGGGEKAAGEPEQDVLGERQSHKVAVLFPAGGDELHADCGEESEKYAANEALDRLLWREDLAERRLAEELAAEEAANIRQL